MRDVVAVLGSIFFLIGLYLVLNRGKESVNIINAFAQNATSGIKTLQGR